jgi:hypothetical protein
MVGMEEAGVFPLLIGKVKKKTGKLVGRLRRLIGLRYRAPVSEEDIFELLRGKTVALVGNARSLLARNYGKAIDDCDVVVRCNAAPIPDTRSHGSRTTFIATSIELPEALMAERGASHVLWMSPPRNALPRWMLKHPGFFLYPAECHKALCAKVGDRPTTGLMVIDLLARSPSRSVALYGFDFFRSQSLSSDRAREKTPHHFGREEAYVLELIGTDSRFELNR